MTPGLPDSVDALRVGLSGTGYLADDALATVTYLASRLARPLLLEGEPGTGKTALAEALYEWNYPRQLLAIRLAESHGSTLDEHDLFGADYLLPRPLLAAIDHPGPRPAVLLIDEVDRADDEFEAFLFELLAEGSVTIPELGTRFANHRPVAILTSNRTRDLHDALKRRCLYHWIRYPAPERVAEIIRRRVPGTSEDLTRRISASVQRMRGIDLYKPPGVAESIAWASALEALGVSTWDAGYAEATLGAVLKYDEDLTAVHTTGLATLLGD
jgi:MoxR-like ATPase